MKESRERDKDICRQMLANLPIKFFIKMMCQKRQQTRSMNRQVMEDINKYRVDDKRREELNQRQYDDDDQILRAF